MKTLLAVGLGLMVLLRPGLAGAGAPTDQLRQTINQVLAILKDPQLKGLDKKGERRKKLEDTISTRFDFTEMAKHALGPHWQQRRPEEQQEFVKLFTGLLEDAYLDKIESYNGERVEFLNEAVDNNYAEVDTKIVGPNGQEFSVNYKLHQVQGEWKVYDVVIENVGLVHNYRSQFNRILAKSSFEELLKKLREKQFSAPGKQS